MGKTIDTKTLNARTKPDLVARYMEQGMIAEIAAYTNSKHKTGFPDLDQRSGGIYPGLYVIAAISGIGKTTFMHQMADQFADQGMEVLYFSLEQSRFELVSKSLARLTYQKNEPMCSNQFRQWGNWHDAGIEAYHEYKDGIGQYISIIESNFSTTVLSIRNYVKKYIRDNHVSPIVFIDYLQVLQTHRKSSAKDNVDQNITDLKRLSRECNIPIFVISSINRASYLSPISFESLKESGSIEYTADVVWGLQSTCVYQEAFLNYRTPVAKKQSMLNAALVEYPRKVDLVCLKNRFGEANFKCHYEYRTDIDTFEELPSKDIDVMTLHEGQRFYRDGEEYGIHNGQEYRMLHIKR